MKFALWQPTYALQENYQLLETMMGLKQHHSILPDTDVFRTPEEEMSSMANQIVPMMASSNPSIATEIATDDKLFTPTSNEIWAESFEPER